LRDRRPRPSGHNESGGEHQHQDAFQHFHLQFFSFRIRQIEKRAGSPGSRKNQFRCYRAKRPPRQPDKTGFDIEQCRSARALNADRPRKLQIGFALPGAIYDACSRALR
jgi:hypothetical protein